MSGGLKTTSTIQANSPASFSQLTVSGNTVLAGTNGIVQLSGTAAGDNVLKALVQGTVRGIRFGTTASFSLIEGVDQTGSGSYQPLQVGGLTLDFTSSGTVIATVSANRISMNARPIRMAVSTVASLPASPLAGDRAFVTDATAPVFGSAVVGGGAVSVPVYYTGSAWFVG